MAFPDSDLGTRAATDAAEHAVGRVGAPSSAARRLSLGLLMLATVALLVDIRLAEGLFWMLGFPMVRVVDWLWPIERSGVARFLVAVTVLVLNTYAWGHVAARAIARVRAARERRRVPGDG